MIDPIIVLGPPRSGTSMVAGIFAAHGVWTGVCRAADMTNQKGFFEGLAVKRVVLDVHGAIVNRGIVARREPGFRSKIENAIRADGYESGPWLWKGSSLYAPAWYEFSPTWVCCQRDLDGIFRSCRGTWHLDPGMSDGRLREIIALHYQIMEGLNRALWIDTDALAMDGDLREIRDALSAGGISPDDDLIRSFVNPTLWHF